MRSITIVRPFRCIKKDGKYYDRVKSAEQLKAYLDVKWAPGVFTFDRFDDFGVAERINFFGFDEFVSMTKNYAAVKAACEQIRNIKDKDERNFYKSTRLPSVFWGQFELRRVEKENGVSSFQFVDDGLKCHSGIICIDVDNIEPEQMSEARRVIDSNPYTLMRFLSPSGNGYKVLMHCDDDICAGLHSGYYAAAINYWREMMPFNIDSSCKNPSRRCYMSHDPEPYVNKNCKLWTRCDEVSDVYTGVDLAEHSVSDDDVHNLFISCLVRVKGGFRTKTESDGTRKHIVDPNKKYDWVDGQKHPFLCALSGMCAKAGMTYEQFRKEATEGPVKYLIDEKAYITAKSFFKK